MFSIGYSVQPALHCRRASSGSRCKPVTEVFADNNQRKHEWVAVSQCRTRRRRCRYHRRSSIQLQLANWLVKNRTDRSRQHRLRPLSYPSARKIRSVSLVLFEFASCFVCSVSSFCAALCSLKENDRGESSARFFSNNKNKEPIRRDIKSIVSVVKKKRFDSFFLTLEKGRRTQ